MAQQKPTSGWTRGKGYYSAHSHALPLRWETFHPAFCSRTERTGRYITYLLSWKLHHKDWPQPLAICDNPANQDEFIQRAEVMEAEEIARREEAYTGRPTSRSKAKR